MLVEPVLVSTRRETVPSHLMIVVDDSESMKFSDPYTDNSRAVDIADALEAGIRGRQVAGRPAARDAAARPGQEGPGPEPGGAGARPGAVRLRPRVGGPARRRRIGADAQARRHPGRIGPIRPWATRLHGVLAAHRGQPVAGVILATDGRSNTGEDPLRAVEAAARQNIPIFSIAAGGDEGPRNIRLAEIEVSPVVFVRDPMMLARRGRGPRPQATPRRRSCWNSGSTTGPGKRWAVSASCWAKTASSSGPSFRLTPRVVGQYEFRARVEDAGPELTQDDNVATAAVRVVRQQIRVLLIAGAASPEVQFLRNALMRDQHVEFAGWIQHADPGFRQPGDRPITRLPNNDSRAAPVRRPAPGRPRPARPGAAVARDDHAFRRPGRGRAHLRRRRALFAAALRSRPTPRRPAATGRGSCPSSAMPVSIAARPRCGSARRTPTRSS